MFFFFPFPAEMPQEARDFFARDTLTWEDFEAVLHYLRTKRPELTVGAALTFIYIARRSSAPSNQEGHKIIISDLAKALTLSYPTAAKHCDVLSDGYGNRQGFGWIVKDEGEDKRMRSVRMSNWGAEFLAEMVRDFHRYELD